MEPCIPSCNASGATRFCHSSVSSVGLHSLHLHLLRLGLTAQRRQALLSDHYTSSLHLLLRMLGDTCRLAGLTTMEGRTMATGKLLLWCSPMAISVSIFVNV